MFTVSTAGFVPGRGTTDAIFIVRQLQEKYIAAKKPLYFAFVDLEKAFDRVPRKMLWWALRSLDVEEWAVCVIQCHVIGTCFIVPGSDELPGTVKQVPIT